MISRRAFLTSTVGASVAARLAADAYAADKPWRIGWLDHQGTQADWEAPFVRALKEMGYTDGRDFILAARHAERRFDRLPALAAELVNEKVDLIIAKSDPAIRAAQQATNRLPIVMVSSEEPVGLGFVASLNRPGGNITGISNIEADLVGKQLDFLKQAVPRLNKVTVLTNATAGAKERARQRILPAAQALHLSFDVHEVPDLPTAKQIFATMTDHRPDGILVISGELLDRPPEIGIAQLALKEKIPLVSDDVYMTYEGGLISYQASYGPQAQRAAWYAVKILTGTKPGELPVEQPTEIRLTVNLDTAQTIGLVIPQSIVLRADKVIE
jgi:putative ABC transport system substrate-binding protein